MACDSLSFFFNEFRVCEETADGARIATHCLYPSFETVHVYIVKNGAHFSVHDGGGAHRASWLHGRDNHVITRSLNKQAERFQLENDKGSLVAPDVTIEWLSSAILTVANASALAAERAVSKMSSAAERALVARIGQTLERIMARERISKEVTIRGKSGGERHFDFAIRDLDEDIILISAVSSHHSSISSKYVAFADTTGIRENKLAVCSRSLETEDVALLQQVASILPIASLQQRALQSIPRLRS